MAAVQSAPAAVNGVALIPFRVSPNAENILVYLANKGQPGTAGNRGALLLPAVQYEQPVNGVYNITRSTPADMTDQATVALYYRRTDVITGNLQIDVPIVRNLPAKTGNYAWDTSRMLAGAHQIKAVIDDGVNALPIGKVTIPDDACVDDERVAAPALL